MRFNEELSKKSIEKEFNCKVFYENGLWSTNKGDKMIKELTLRNLRLALNSNY